MKARTIWLAVIFFLPVAGFFFSPAGAQKAGSDKGINAPTAVLTAFHKAYPNTEIKNVGTETRDSAV